MKILVVYCSAMYRAIAELAKAEGVEIVHAATYESARRILSRGVDGLITNIQMPQAKRESRGGYGQPSTIPWGIALTAAAQIVGTPALIVLDGYNATEKMKLVSVLFDEFGCFEPEMVCLYAGGNKKNQREVYMKLRRKMRKPERPKSGLIKSIEPIPQAKDRDEVVSGS